MFLTQVSIDEMHLFFDEWKISSIKICFCIDEWFKFVEERFKIIDEWRFLY